jgi:hypothetical protein
VSSPTHTGFEGAKLSNDPPTWASYQEAAGAEFGADRPVAATLRTRDVPGMNNELEGRRLSVTREPIDRAISCAAGRGALLVLRGKDVRRDCPLRPVLGEASYGNVALSCGVRNHVRTRGLPGGAEGIRTLSPPQPICNDSSATDRPRRCTDPGHIAVRPERKRSTSRPTTEKFVGSPRLTSRALDDGGGKDA